MAEAAAYCGRKEDHPSHMFNKMRSMDHDLFCPGIHCETASDVAHVARDIASAITAMDQKHTRRIERVTTTNVDTIVHEVVDTILRRHQERYEQEAEQASDPQEKADALRAVALLARARADEAREAAYYAEQP